MKVSCNEHKSGSKKFCLHSSTIAGTTKIFYIENPIRRCKAVTGSCVPVRPCSFVASVPLEDPNS